MTDHRHRARHRGVSRAWMYPLRRDDDFRRNPRADGNVVFDETCRCGATRQVAVNLAGSEYGPWVELEGGDR